MPELIRLPEVLPPGQPNNLPAVPNRDPTPPQLEYSYEAPPVPLSHYFWILRRHRWKMAGFVAICVVLTAVVSMRLKPIYESTAGVDVDRQAPTEAVGEDSTRSSTLNDADQFLATQIRMIQSDPVLRPVAAQFNLLEREGQQKGLSPEMAQEKAEEPVVLKNLKVIRPPNTYLLQISYRSPDRVLSADVANAIANSYLSHTYDIRIRSSANLSSFMEKQLDELKAKMEKSGLALAQFEKDLDVVSPEEKTNILSSRLLELNTDYTAAQADRVQKEAAWNAMKSGSLEAAQVSSQGEELAKLNEELNQARAKVAMEKSIHGPRHPDYRQAVSEQAELEKQFESMRSNVSGRIQVEYREALNREQMLQKTVADTKAEWDKINAKSFEYQQLKQEADTDKSLYEELIRKIREADINAGFQNNNIRIAYLARASSHPVFPNTRLNLLLALFFSSLLAAGAALFLDAVDTTLRDPKTASQFLGTDVIGTMPVDRLSAKLPKNVKTVPETAIVAKSATNRNRNGYGRTASVFEESVRTIRNTILLSDFEGRLHSIVVTSAAPGEGKSTIAAHLAIANADRGKKTLLVDGDLRRPSMHAKFGFAPREGLSNVLTGELAWRDVILPIKGTPNMSLLPSGLGSHRAADLIGPRLATLLDEFAKEFDLVIIDSPPLLGFAECLQMATAADGVLIISRAGETKRKAVAEVISVLNRVHASIVGVVLNQVSQNMSGDGYSYYGYSSYGYNQKSE